jgi:ABC-type bacteriocin/lantibiotic exporter with double-glycine peptidase domain
MNYIKKIIAILTKKNKAGFLSIVFLSIFKTAIEILSLGLLIPILSILSNAEKKSQIFIYFPFVEEFNENQLLFLFLFIFIFFYLIKTIYVIFFNIYAGKYSHDLYVEISEKLLEKYLENKFIFFTHNNSANLVKNVASETNGFAIGTIGACVTIVTNTILFLSICALLIFYNYNFIFIIIVLFIICGGIINFSRKEFSKWGKVRHIESAKMVQKLNEVIGSIKEVILYNKKKFFVTQIKEPFKNFSNAAVYKDAFTSITSPLIEFIAILIFFIFLSYVIFYSKKSFAEIIVISGIFGYASIKILPNLIGIARSIQILRFNFPAVDIIYSNIIKNKKHKIINYTFVDSVNSITFKKVDFFYPKNNYPVLKNINLKINKGDKIGIIGVTGSGKTTLINLISGLLSPTKGKILVNSSKFFNSKKFKINIGYVSQSVYLSDDNIMKNIALSNEISEKNINFIKSLLKILNLNNFNNKIDINKLLGERGLKLSGGQIQRIGIARALYRNPSLLILDEATNALDDKTEDKILSYLFKKFEDKIIIFCTHKKKLLKYCNKIIEVRASKLNLIKK